MPRTRPPYPAVFRQQMVDLVRSGRTPEELTREFEPSAQAIRNWVAQADRDAGERTDGLVRTGDRTREVYRFMSANQARFRIATMARVFGVSPSGYYAWRRRPLSARAQANADLTARVQAIHAGSRGTYGAPRIHAELADAGVAVSRKRVALVMRAAGVAGVSRRRAPRTTRRDSQAQPAPDRVERRFEADAPNRLWVADITYVPTLVGFLYLAIVLDVFSRRVVGWAMATHLRTELVIEALEMAVAQSMGSTGDCFDNSMAESFFATLECELLDRTTLSTYAEARAAVFDFIERWYNTRRRHSALGYRSPLEFERLHAGPVDGVRPVDTLQVPTSPLDPALRAGSTPPTGRDLRTHVMP